MPFSDEDIFEVFAEATGYLPAKPVRVGRRHYKDDCDFIELARLQKQAIDRLYYQRNRLNRLAYQLVHRARNRDYYREKSRAWRADPANREKAKAATARWREKNRDRIRAQDRARVRKRLQTENEKAYRKAYRQRNRDRINENQRKRRKEKRNAKRKL